MGTRNAVADERPPASCGTTDPSVRNWGGSVGQRGRGHAPGYGRIKEMHVDRLRMWVRSRLPPASPGDEPNADPRFHRLRGPQNAKAR